MKIITKFGNTMTILIVVIILMIILNKKEGIMLGISTVDTVLINQIIKYIIRRPRPSHLRLIKQGGYSFPSGHAMISIAVYGFLIYIINKKIENKKLKIILTVLLTLLIILIGISRIYVGVHYPSDIIAGYSISLAILILNITLCNKYLRGN
jgi:undecaprenyl-diphosphatase